MKNDEDDIWDNREYPSAEEYDTGVDQNSESIYAEEEQDDDELYEDFDEDLEELFDDGGDTSLIGEAKSRIEQARLYELLLEHDLFDGVDAIPQVVSRVQQEIKDFIEERYLILSGMKSEKEEVKHIIKESQFNGLEVQVLRRLASKFSKGMTENVPEEEEVESEPSELKTIKKVKPRNKINTLGNKTAQLKVKKKGWVNKGLKKKTPLPTNQKVPRRKITKEMADTSVDNLTLDAAARKDLKYVESLKNMSLEQANEVVAQRHTRPQPKKQLNQDAINSHYTTRAAVDNTKINDYTKVLRMVAMQKAQERGDDE